MNCRSSPLRREHFEKDLVLSQAQVAFHAACERFQGRDMFFNMGEVDRVAAFEKVRHLARLSRNDWILGGPRWPSLRGTAPHLQDCFNTAERRNCGNLLEPF